MFKLFMTQIAKMSFMIFSTLQVTADVLLRRISYYHTDCQHEFHDFFDLTGQLKCYYVVNFYFLFFFLDHFFTDVHTRKRAPQRIQTYINTRSTPLPQSRTTLTIELLYTFI